MSTATNDQVEAAAMAVWRTEMDGEPTEPLHSHGGALDPRAWCMKVAQAVVNGTPLPPRAKDVDLVEGDPVVVAAREAVSGGSS